MRAKQPWFIISPLTCYGKHTVLAPLKIITLNESTMKLKIDFYSSEEHVSGTVSQKQQLGKNINHHSDGACFSARMCMVWLLIVKADGNSWSWRFLRFSVFSKKKTPTVSNNYASTSEYHKDFKEPCHWNGDIHSIMKTSFQWEEKTHTGKDKFCARWRIVQ